MFKSKYLYTVLVIISGIVFISVLYSMVSDRGAKSYVPFSDLGSDANGPTGGSDESVKIKAITSIDQYHEQIQDYIENPPDLDFEKGQVLIAYSNSRSSSGYSVKILGLEDQKTHLLANVVVYEPGYGCYVFYGTTDPWHMIYVPMKKEVKVAEYLKTYEC